MVDQQSFARLQAVREFIAQHYDEPLKLQTLADEAGYSPFHFQRQFVRAFDQSPNEFLVDFRLKRAQELLRSRDLSVQEVCVEVGYTSLASFSDLFSRTVGCPPTEYRRVFSMPDIWSLRCIPACFRTNSL